MTLLSALFDGVLDRQSFLPFSRGGFSKKPPPIGNPEGKKAIEADER
jgi:hypothetical protein